VQNQSMSDRSRAVPAAGFSLVELMIAMVVTLLVSGAVYGLLTTGQNAFRREPEMADRQQSIRVAMDVISKDVIAAGTNLPGFVQVFTDNDPGGGAPLNGLGPPGAMGAPGQAQRNADPSANSDVLEIVAAEDWCPGQSVCTNLAPGTVGTFMTKEPNPSCLAPAGGLPGFAVLTDNTNMVIQPIVAPDPQPCPAGGSANNGGVQLGPAVAVGPNPITPLITPPAAGANTFAFLFPARISRYMIGFDPGDPDRVPLLWRSVTGRYADDGSVATPPPGVPTGAAATGNWQVLARGIEDLQVEYMDGLGNWNNSPPAAVPCPPPGAGCGDVNAYNAIVRQVRVTLSARVVAQNLQGQQTAGAGAGVAPDRIRGQLVNVIQPRAAHTTLMMGNFLR
jgi:prepilin-type N-terminal cleavage/methylation domain-containing protein